jgi:hypothetical protein
VGQGDGAGPFLIWPELRTNTMRKVAGAGELVWQRTLGGSNHEELYDLCATNDGGWVLGGIVGSQDGDAFDNPRPHSAWIVKLDAAGPTLFRNLQWMASTSFVRHPEFGTSHRANLFGTRSWN